MSSSSETNDNNNTVVKRTRTTKTEYKTPSYVRKALKKYDEKIREDPEKNQKRLEYQRNYYQKKIDKKNNDILLQKIITVIEDDNNIDFTKQLFEIIKDKMNKI